jgi:hypothetical protein
VAILRHNTAAAFLDQAAGWLEGAVAENNLRLGVAVASRADLDRFSANLLYLAVKQADETVGAALVTLRGLILARVNDEAPLILAKQLSAKRAALLELDLALGLRLAERQPVERSASGGLSSSCRSGKQRAQQDVGRTQTSCVIG